MRSVGFFVLWLVGGAIAVSVAFAGIAVVDDELIDPPPAQVSNVGDRLGNAPAATDAQSPASPSPDSATGENVDRDPATDDGGGQVGPAATTTARPTTSVAAAPTETAVPTARPTTSVAAAPTATAVPSSATAVPPTAVPAVPTSTSVPLTAVATAVPPVPTSTSVPPTAVPTAAPTATKPPEPQAQVVTFNLVGGSTAISFSASAIEVLWASANPGFEVDIDPGSDVRVEFDSDDHRSRLDAWWAGGPQHEIREDAD